jgi:hypothetical protein
MAVERQRAGRNGRVRIPRVFSEAAAHKKGRHLGRPSEVSWKEAMPAAIHRLVLSASQRDIPWPLHKLDAAPVFADLLHRRLTGAP